MNIFCKFGRHILVVDNLGDDLLTGAKHCTRKKCNHKIPKKEKMKFDKKRLAHLFNIWNERYSKNPDDFKQNTLDEDGKLRKNYGENCADYLQELEDELETE